MSNLSDFLPYLKLGSDLQRSARTSNAQLVAADNGKLINITSGTFTQTFAAAAALGDGWWCYLGNSGEGDITIPSSDGRTNWIMYPGEIRLFQCDGVTLRSIVINAFNATFTTSGNFIKPPGYSSFSALLWAGGGWGGTGLAGGGGGACAPIGVPESKLSSSESVVIGAGGVSSGVGGASSFAGVTSFGGFSGGAGVGGGGGGCLGAGAGSGGGKPNPSASEGVDNSGFGGGGGGGESSPSGGLSFYGGGGGGSRYTSGGSSVYGGGGGAGLNSTFGTSKFGGSGGPSGGNGIAPGGGGGANAAGARGELRIWGVI